MNHENYQAICEKIENLSSEELWELIAKIRTLLAKRGKII